MDYATTYCGETYRVTTEHAASSYGIPVVVTPDGRALGPWDDVSDEDATSARVIAGQVLDEHPHDAEVCAAVRRFFAVKSPHHRAAGREYTDQEIADTFFGGCLTEAEWDARYGRSAPKLRGEED